MLVKVASEFLNELCQCWIWSLELIKIEMELAELLQE
jgi:hypothetical protein